MKFTPLNAGAIEALTRDRDLVMLRVTRAMSRVSCREGRARRKTMGVTSMDARLRLTGDDCGNVQLGLCSQRNECKTGAGDRT